MDNDCKILLVSSWNYNDVPDETLRRIIKETNPPPKLEVCFEIMSRRDLIEYIKDFIIVYERYAVKTFDILIEETNINTKRKRRKDFKWN